MSPATGPEDQRSTTNPWGYLPGWSNWTGGDELERVPELQWPMATTTYQYMMNDAQIFSLIMSLILPIRSWRWHLKKNGAQDAIVQRISADYNLPIEDDMEFNRRRGQRRFSFDKHLEDALRAVYLGYYPFEQVGDILPEDLKWHLRKLAPIPPRTLSEITLAADGGLDWIKQLTAKATDPPISVDRLVWYVWDREGANWTGRSMCRSVYRNHLVKDRVLRVGAINIERAGGIPYVQAAEGATGDQIKALDLLARRFRVGEEAGAALPHGAQLKFASAAGGDGAVAYIKQQNEEMARAFLQMVNMLGQTNTGSRALGGTFQDIAQVAQFTIAKWFCDIFNEHVIEDDVEWNEGPSEEFAPLLAFDAGEADPLTGFRNALGQDDGIQVDPQGVTAQILTQGEPTPRTARRPRQVRASSPGDAAGRDERGRVTAERSPSPLLLPPRPLRRNPNEHEIRAAIDFMTIDSNYASMHDLLIQEVRQVRSFQADEIREAILEANGNLSKLARLDVTARTDQAIQRHLQTAAQLAAGQAVTEARAQGVTLPQFDTEPLIEQLTARASAVDEMLASEFAQSASRNAIRLSGGGLSPQEVAEQVKSDLLAMSGAYAKDVLGGALQQSINAGRNFVFEHDEHAGELFSSEILDTNTCGHCIANDGKSYPDVAAAVRDYPTGTFRDCDGRERCRGMVIKVYQTADVTTVEPLFQA